MKLNPANYGPLSEEMKRFINGQNPTMSEINFGEDYSAVRTAALAGGGSEHDDEARALARDAMAAAESADARALDSQNLVGAETTRAKTQETAIANSLASEVLRAQGKEATLQDNIADERQARFDADNMLQSRINTEAAARQDAINAEATARQNADVDLQNAIDAEALARQSADTAETTRAQEAEQANTDAISAEATRAQGAEQANTDTINAETTRAQGAEQANTDAISTEATRAQEAESSLQTALSAESERASSRENEIGTELTQEAARAMADEAGLAEKITAEEARAQAAEQAAQATADEAKAIAESAIHLRGVLMFGADTIVSMQGIPEARISEGDACGVQETNLTYIWDGDQSEWIEQAHGADAVGDQWNMNSWYGVWQNQTFSGNATASIVCVTTEPLYWALTVSESTGVGGDLGINGDHIDISSQTAPSEITEDAGKFAGGFAAKFSGFFHAAISKINGLFSLVKGCQEEEAALEARIEEEAGAREAGDEGLQEAIDAEASEREAGDAGLQEAIDTEAGARETADTGLQESIDAETSTRESGDAALQTSIDVEAGAREQADAEKLNIADIETGYTPEGTLQIAGVTGETEMNDAEEIALYTHHLKIRVMNGTTFVIWFGLELFLNENTPFTAETFWQWLADQGYTSEEASKPINGRFTTDGQSSLDAGAVWTNAAATQIMVTTIASSGTAVQTIALGGKTTTVDDFVKEAPFNIVAHKHGFRIEDMSGGFVGTLASKVLQVK